MPPTVRIKNPWSEQRIFAQRTLGAALVIGALVLVLIGRLVDLQVLRHDYYVELSQGNRVRLEPIPASRGLILDRNAKVLADNAPAYELELIREQVPDLQGTLKRLAALGLIDPDQLEDMRRVILARRSFDIVPVQLRLSDEQIGRFAVHRFEFPGVDLATRQTRHYPHGELAVHALGYVGALSEQDLEHIDRVKHKQPYLEFIKVFNTNSELNSIFNPCHFQHYEPQRNRRVSTEHRFLCTIVNHEQSRLQSRYRCCRHSGRLSPPRSRRLLLEAQMEEEAGSGDTASGR